MAFFLVRILQHMNSIFVIAVKCPNSTCLQRRRYSRLEIASTSNIFLLHQSFQRCIHLRIHPYLHIPALFQLYRFVKYVQSFYYHMFDISRQFYIVFDWVFNCVIERWEKYRKVLPLFHLLYLVLEPLKVKSIRSPSIFRSMLIQILPIQMKPIHGNHNRLLK